MSGSSSMKRETRERGDDLRIARQAACGLAAAIGPPGESAYRCQLVMATTLFTQNTIACIWDFDKTLIPEYMQSPLFRRYGIDEANFWEETNKLAEHYRRRGYHLSPEISYLNHLLTHVLAGPLAGLSNKI